MTKELTIEEGNKLIAEFMGFDLSDTAVWEYRTIERPSTVEDLEYHSSWDWLMPVVEKIQTVNVDVCLQFCNGNTNCNIKPVEFKINFFFVNKSAISAIWQTVVQFIQWYNKSKQ